MKEPILTFLAVNLSFVIFVIYLAVRRERKQPQKFIQLLNKHSIVIKDIERDLKNLLETEGKLSFGELMFNKQNEIILGCIDNFVTPEILIEGTVRRIKTSRFISEKEKKIMLYSDVLGLFYLIKEAEEIYNMLENKDFENEQLKAYLTEIGE